MLAEGLYWLLDEGGRYDVDLAYWGRFLVKRSSSLTM